MADDYQSLDGLEAATNKYVNNNPVDAFTQRRMNNIMIGTIKQIRDIVVPEPPPGSSGVTQMNIDAGT